MAYSVRGWIPAASASRVRSVPPCSLKTSFAASVVEVIPMPRGAFLDNNARTSYHVCALLSTAGSLLPGSGATGPPGSSAAPEARYGGKCCQDRPPKSCHAFRSACGSDDYGRQTPPWEAGILPLNYARMCSFAPRCGRSRAINRPGSTHCATNYRFGYRNQASSPGDRVFCGRIAQEPDVLHTAAVLCSGTGPVCRLNADAPCW